MQPDRGTDVHACRSTRASTSFSLLELFLIAVPFVFAACGDDGNVLGSDAGNAGQAGGGSHAGSSSSAGSGHAGTLMNAGTTGGGTAGGGAIGGGTTGGGTTGGSTTGGAGSAGQTSTGGAACAIPEGCAAAAGQGGGGQDSVGCVGVTCGASQTCVAYRTVGGAIFRPDAAGECMAGKHVENNLCQPDFAYTCAELIGCSAPATTCHCAATTQCANDGVCRLPTAAAWLDPSAELVCEQQVP